MTDETPSQGLLACPFCGGGNVCSAGLTMSERFMGIGDSHAKTHRFCRVRCLDCGTEQGRADAYKTDADAIAAWNARAPIASIPEPDMRGDVVERVIADFERIQGYKGDEHRVMAIAAIDAACPRHE